MSPKARSSDYLSMEMRPPPSEGKGGEAPSFTARFLLLIELAG